MYFANIFCMLPQVLLYMFCVCTDPCRLFLIGKLHWMIHKGTNINIYLALYIGSGSVNYVHLFQTVKTWMIYLFLIIGHIDFFFWFTDLFQSLSDNALLNYVFQKIYVLLQAQKIIPHKPVLFQCLVECQTLNFYKMKQKTFRFKTAYQQW